MLTALKKFYQSLTYACAGIKTGLSTQRHLRFHFFSAVIVLLSAIWLKCNSLEWAILIACITGVIGMELLNTSIELLTDELHPEIHPNAKRIKDLAAGAVLMVSIGAAIIGFLILLPKLIQG